MTTNKTTANTIATAVNEGALNALSIEQLLEEIDYVDEALETLSLERDIVGDCEEINNLETRFRNYRRKFVELLGFDPSDSVENDSGDYVPAEVSSSSGDFQDLEIPF